MVVVMSGTQLEYRCAALEVVPGDKSRGLKLSEYSVDRGQTRVFIGFEQHLIHVFCRNVFCFGTLEHLEDLNPRVSYLESGIAKFLIL